MDMLNGSIWDKILKMAIPLAASGILQQLFNAADIAVVGQFVGGSALAAVGANSPVINLLVNLFVGLSVGANVVISTAFGERSARSVSRGVHTSILVSLLSGVFLAVIGVVFARPILEFISTPSDILEQAVLYLRIYFVGMPFIMLFNFAAAVLRSKGDTRRPFYVLLVSGAVNVAFNLFFVLVCKMDVEGVAIATVIANVVSSVSLVYFLMHEVGPLKFEFWKLRITPFIFKRIVHIGLPAGLQGVVFSFSNVCIQSAINSLGSATIAASAAALNYEYFIFFWLSSFSAACVTIVSQNKGANNIPRCRSVLRWTLLLNGISTVIIGALMALFARPLLHLFTSDAQIVEIAVIRVYIVMALEIVNVFLDNISAALRGLGHSLAPAVICAVGVCGVRIVWVWTVFPCYRSFKALMTVYPVSWTVAGIVIVGMYFYVIRKLNRATLMNLKTSK